MLIEKQAVTSFRNVIYDGFIIFQDNRMRQSVGIRSGILKEVQPALSW